jgi:hypothetical protein
MPILLAMTEFEQFAYGCWGFFIGMVLFAAVLCVFDPNRSANRRRDQPPPSAG